VLAPERLGLAAAIALFLAVWLGAAPPAAANTPTGEREAAGAAPPSAGLLAPIGRAVLTFQREANRAISAQMRAIRDGTTTKPLALGLLLAFAYGAVHAAGPGHGKLVVVSYFLSREARVGRGLLMGAQIALMHVLSAIVIVVFADLLLRKGFGGAPSEVPAVRLVSYGLILTIGLAMLWRAVRRARAPTHHEHDAQCGCGARHDESGLLSLGVGLVPCTGSILILLYAMANGILPAGLLLVGMIALGMAVTMGALGLASVFARRLVTTRIARHGRTAVVLDVGGALAITALGAVLIAGSV
jgi:ABC-type nickel/cobalt efflux system permease component RcnA